MATPTVTVVMAARNAADTVKEAVQSILDQTMDDLELVIVDDGSSDDTPLVVSDLAKSDSRVCIIRNNRPLGRPASRNRAILATTAPYIAIADADDRSRPDRLQRQVAAMADSALAVVGGQVVDFGVWGGPKQTLQYPLSCDSIQRRLRRGQNAIPHQACLIRRDHLAKAGLYDSALLRCQDLELFLRLSDIGRLANLTDILVEYRTDGTSPSLRYFRENARYRTAACYLYRLRKLDSSGVRLRMALSSYLEFPRWVRSSIVRRRGLQKLS